MDIVQNLIQNQDFASLTTLLEDWELEGYTRYSNTPSQTSHTSSSPTATSATHPSITQPAPLRLTTLLPLLLCTYLIQNDLPAARALIKRTPLQFRQNIPDFGPLVDIFNKLWNRDIPAVYPLLSAATATNGQGEGDDSSMKVETESSSGAGNSASTTQHTWDATLTPLILALRQAIQNLTFRLLGRAYESLPASAAATYLGVPSASEMEPPLAQAGWSVDQQDGDESKHWLFPPAPGVTAASDASGAAAAGKSGEGTGVGELTNLTKFVVHLGRA
ncbi:COP9 signalosome complex subunit 8 [Rhizophlyctis rosea]|nr:COP9 signalosome complex subunit 8 [Rhizophlyctis rosea]